MNGGDSMVRTRTHAKHAYVLTSLCPGDIIRIVVMGQPVVVLGSFKVATDLLDTRGKCCSYTVIRKMYLYSVMQEQYTLIDHLL